MNLKAHHEKCTPDEPCGDCASREIGERLGSGTSTGGKSAGTILRERWLENKTKRAAKKIDSFFETAGADAVKGFYSRTAVEIAEDDMINPNPLG